MSLRSRLHPLARSRAIGYAGAVLVPIALSLLTAWLKLPQFVFEPVVVFLVLVIAIVWGFGPSGVAALVAVIADNILLQEPIGRPSMTGYRDVIDLLLFATVAVVVSGLVTRAQAARMAAQQAASRERTARTDLDRLIATVAHDLATPLSVLRNTVHFAKMRGASQVDWGHLLDRLDTASARATSLMHMLTDARRLDEEGPPFAFDKRDLRSLASPIVQMMDRFSERHPVMLSVPDEPVLVMVDGPRLQRVLENLVNNAIKYSPDGGPVEVSLSIEGGEAVLRVRDHGIGIPEDALPHIFKRSFRSAEAAAHAPGLGLGLSIAAQVISRHNGTISAGPADGRGTVVVVRMPLAAVREGSSEQPTRSVSHLRS